MDIYIDVVFSVLLFIISTTNLVKFDHYPIKLDPTLFVCLFQSRCIDSKPRAELLV